MHPYSTDSNERVSVPLVLAVISIILALIFHRLAAYLKISVPWWFETPSVMGIYGLSHRLFDCSLWKLSILRKFGIVKIPDLNGPWKGKAISSFDGHSSSHEVTMEIQQYWSRISVVLRAPNSSSHSLIGGILIDNPMGTMLCYEYLSEPRPNAPATMQTHRGTACLILGRDQQIFEGDYYSGRGRTNHGVLNLRRTND